MDVYGFPPLSLLTKRIVAVDGTAAYVAMSEVAKGCSHFNEFRRAHGLQSYRIIYKYLVKPGAEARKLKVTRGHGGVGALLQLRQVEIICVCGVE